MQKIKITLLITSISLFLYYITDSVLTNREVYHRHFADRLTYEQIDKLLEKGQIYAWLKYLIVGFSYLCKFLLTSFCLYLGYFLSSSKVKIRFGDIFKIVVLSEIIFFIPVIIRLFWFSFVKTNYTLQDLQFFYPLSALNFFDNQLEPWLTYPLQILNLFEITYWILLAYGMNRILTPPFEKQITENSMDLESAFRLVVTSYGTGLIIWVALVMFLTLNYSP